jgi:hopanoid biosynthesis associated protein HpnK
MLVGRTLITVADDFGLSPAINAAVEQAARDGILTSASLMVAAPAAADAVARARALGDTLRVGLHLVVIEGPAVLPKQAIPDLVGGDGEFPSDQLRMGIDYAFRPALRRQLEAEIRAQFEAFAATGLALDHANAHKHMHLHPVVGHLMLRIGREFGLRAVRVPTDAAPPRGLGDRALKLWTKLLRAQARRAGMLTNDSVLGLHDSGQMTPALVQRLVDSLPPGLTELYFHPAVEQDAIIRRHMPGYRHQDEFAALLQARLPADVRLTTYSELLA